MALSRCWAWEHPPGSAAEIRNGALGGKSPGTEPGKAARV